MGLNLSLKGQKIVPKLTQKREIKCERTENKSLQSIYTLARLASSSSRVRRATGISTGPTIMDFMQCINFKSRLDREREMIRRKIRSSTIYRKPSFNVFHSNGDLRKMSCIAKNIKIDEFKDESSRKLVKSPFLCEENENDGEKGLSCVGSNLLEINGSKYLGVVTSNKFSIDISPNNSIVKSFSSSTLCLNDAIEPKETDFDFEKAISQSHLSPALFVKNDDDEVNVSSDNGEINSPSLNNRKDHTKIIRKSTKFRAVAHGKYTDAKTSEVPLDDFSNSAHQNIKNQITSDTSKTKKTKKKSSRRLEASPKTTTTR